MTSCICPKCGDAHICEDDEVLISNELIPAFEPTVRCPKCWTNGHAHRKDCPYRDNGMKYHVPIK